MSSVAAKVEALKKGLRTGEVLICNFDTGFKVPEMVKQRPVVVVSKTSTHWRGLCTVVPFSTTVPKPKYPWHVQIIKNPLYGHLPPNHPFGQDVESWAKCDMLCTVAFERLTRVHRRVNGKRDYSSVRIDAVNLNRIINGMHAYLPASIIHASKPV